MVESIQVVVVKWETKYDFEIVNRMRRAIGRYCDRPFNFFCFTDSPDSNYHPDIVIKPFPPFSADFDELKRGCRLKLSIFAPGILDETLPTLFFDLDTIIFGNIGKLVDELDRNRGLFMLRNHYIQWWKLPDFLKRLAGNKYYFGNSSVLGFYPSDFHDIFVDFNADIQKAPTPLPKYLSSDERYMSYRAGRRVRVFSKRLANKFAEEYMLPWPFLEELRKRLPWVRRRRAGMVAMTFVSDALKPQRIVTFTKGDIIRYKNVSVRWDHDMYADYYREAMNGG